MLAFCVVGEVLWDLLFYFCCAAHTHRVQVSPARSRNGGGTGRGVRAQVLEAGAAGGCSALGVGSERSDRGIKGRIAIGAGYRQHGHRMSRKTIEAGDALA